MAALVMTDEARSLAASFMPYDEANAVAAASRARRAHSAEVVAAALTQARLATRARARFGDVADQIWWTQDGLEQASRPEVAARHAARLTDRGATQVLDLCCSIGLDSFALAQAGLSVEGVDIDSETIEIARANAAALGLEIPFHVGDATDPRWTGPHRGGEGGAIFIDPARRGARGRALNPESWSPPWSWVSGIDADLALAKIAPGIEHAALPESSATEWTSIGGSVLEASVLFGRQINTRSRTAVLLDRGLTLEDSAAETTEVGQLGAWLFEPTGAAIRAGLVSQVAALVAGRFLHPRIAYLTGDTEVDSPWAHRFRVLEEIPFGVKGMRAHLRARGYGNVVVKKRGVAVEPEQLRAQLRLSGDGPTATIVLARLDRPLALLVEPCA